MNTSPTPPVPPGAALPASSDTLAHAARLSDRARRSARWYSTYLLVFAAGSFAISVLTGAWPGPRGVLVTTLLWAAFLTVTTVWISRKPTSMRGMSRVHAAVMVCWGLAWAATVLLGEHYFATSLAWWVLGGVAVALPPVVGAVVAYRRTA